MFRKGREKKTTENKDKTHDTRKPINKIIKNIIENLLSRHDRISNNETCQ